MLMGPRVQCGSRLLPEATASGRPTGPVQVQGRRQLFFFGGAEKWKGRGRYSSSGSGERGEAGVPPPAQLGGMGECYELPHWGLPRCQCFLRWKTLQKQRKKNVFIRICSLHHRVVYSTTLISMTMN